MSDDKMHRDLSALQLTLMTSLYFRDSSGLTKREVEILGLVGQGTSKAEIAGEFFVGETTVMTR